MSQITGQKVPFVTRDSYLAAILQMLRIPRLGVWNTYTERRLRDLGCRTVKEALERGKPGDVIYFFEDGDQTQKIAATYATQREQDRAGRATETHTNFTTAEFVRLVASGLSMRGVFASLWRDDHTAVMFMEGGEATNDHMGVTATTEMVEEMNKAGVRHANGEPYKVGETIKTGGITNIGAMKWVNIKASPETRRKAGF